jgi:hypothetical protein
MLGGLSLDMRAGHHYVILIEKVALPCIFVKEG